MDKILFELQEVCFEEDDVCCQGLVERIIRELLAVEFEETDKKECADNEIRLRLQHLEGEDEEYIGHFWLKFKIYQDVWRKAFFELQEISFEDDYVCNYKEVGTFFHELFNGGFYATDREKCKDDNEVRLKIQYLSDELNLDYGYYWIKFKVKKEKNMIIRATTIAQYKILNFIQQNFEDGSIEMELLDADKVKVTDKKGDSITLSMNTEHQIFDYDTKEILEISLFNH